MKAPSATGRGFSFHLIVPALQQAVHRHFEEGLPAAGAEAGVVELIGNLLVGQALRMQGSSQPAGLPVLWVGGGIVLAHLSALGNGSRRQVAMQPHRLPSLLLGSQRRFGALRNGFAFMLGDDGKDADCKRIGVGHIAAHEVYSRVAQGHDEAGIAAKSVELGDQQRGAVQAGRRDGRQQLGPVVSLAALHFYKFREQLARLRGEGVHGRALSFKAQPRLALSNSGNAVVRNVATRRH